MFLRNQKAYAQAAANQGRNAISPVVINNSRFAVGRMAEQFGQIHPAHADRRQQAHRAHTADNWDPRGPSIKPLIEPIPQRHAVAMTYRFSPHLQKQLSAGRMNRGNEGRIRKSFRDIDPIHISPDMPMTNAVTGSNIRSALPRLL